MAKGRAIGHGISDRGVDIVELYLGCQRARLAVLVKRISNLDFSCFFCHPRMVQLQGVSHTRAKQLDILDECGHHQIKKPNDLDEYLSIKSKTPKIPHLS